MSYAEMLPSPWPVQHLAVQSARNSPPDLVLHRRVGQTIMWVKSLIVGGHCGRQELSSIMLRFAQLFVPLTTSLFDNFVCAAYLLAHPSESQLEAALTMSMATVMGYVDAVFTEGFGDHTQAKFDAAVLAGDIEAAKLAVMAEVNAGDQMSTTALMVAAREQDSEMVSWLLAIGADPRAQDVFGETYLSYGVVHPI